LYDILRACRASPEAVRDGALFPAIDPRRRDMPMLQCAPKAIDPHQTV
jgi:hypothetical protein